MGLVHESTLSSILDYTPPILPPYSIEVLANVPPGPLQKLNMQECSQCLCLDTILFDQRQDLLVCQYCGDTSIPRETVHYVRASRMLARPRQYSGNFFKREIHFRTWLHRLQGKESKRVPGQIIDSVRSLLCRNGVSDIHYWVVKNALKKLKQTRYYNNTIQIMSAIRGKPLFRLTLEQERRLVSLFLSIQTCFSAISDARVNMLSYPYVIRKLCEKIGWRKIANSIPLLKSSSRIQVQDQLWKRICQEKQWTFKATALHSTLDTRNPYSTRI